MLAIIPARGGSKGLPGKNIKLLNNKPLIAYTIEAALRAKKISKVVVSTDDPEIAEISKAYGAEIPFMRPSFLATDKAKSIDVIKYSIERLEKESNKSIENVIILQPTSPLRNESHIDEAIKLFENHNADSVISYCKEEHPIFWHKFISENGKFEEIFSKDFLRNRQDIRETYHPNGAIYIFNRDMINKEQYYSDKSYAYIMDRTYSADIDTKEDWDYVEFLINNKIVN